MTNQTPEEKARDHIDSLLKQSGKNIFTFHRPETLREWLKRTKSVRAALQDLNDLPTEGLRKCQIKAILEFEKSVNQNKPRS